MAANGFASVAGVARSYQGRDDSYAHPVSARSSARGHNRAPVAPSAAMAKEPLLAPGKAFRPA
jgi:hypothetical protein